MRWKDAADQYCSVARTLGVVGDRWTLLIVREAFHGVRRFDDFRTHLGVARNVLTDRLQRLVEAEVLEPVQYQASPPRHEYRLTERGRDLYDVLVAMLRWGDRWLSDEQGPPLLLHHQSCGHDVTPRLTCSACGEAIDAHNSRLYPGPGMPESVAESRRRELQRLRAQRTRAKSRKTDA